MSAPIISGAVDPASSVQAVVESFHAAHWGIVAVIKILVILAVCLVVWQFLRHMRKVVLKKIERLHQEEQLNDAGHHFLMAFLPVGMSILRFLIFIFGSIACLSALGISTSVFSGLVLLFAVGLSMGAKDLFTDILRGFLTLAEGKIALGNFVTINGSSGVVQTLTIRKIELCYPDGSIEVFPFSKVGTIRNYSISYHVARPTFQLESSSSIVRFEEFATETLRSMRQEPEFSHFFHKDTPETLKAIVTEMKNDGIIVYVSILVTQDPKRIFESAFFERMLPKLQEADMLYDPYSTVRILESSR